MSNELPYILEASPAWMQIAEGFVARILSFVARDLAS
jgi:hypothetical protein